MNIQSFFNKYQKIIDRELKGYLTFNLKDNRKFLESALLYSVTAKAKRIRPLLVIATFLLFDKDIKKILPLACAIEMVHAYSLIHDDLPAMDNDDFRRGQLTCHKKFGEDIAILAGDVLNTYAFEVLANELPKYYSPEKTVHIIKELAISFGIQGMAGGQILDLVSQNQALDEKYLRTTHVLKTGAVLKACIVLTAKLQLAAKDDIKYFKEFGDHLGLLFQIVDDILDIKGDKKTLGKTPGKDLKQNKLTYIKLLGLEKSQKLAEKTAECALKTLAKLENYDTLLLKEITKYILIRTN